MENIQELPVETLKAALEKRVKKVQIEPKIEKDIKKNIQDFRDVLHETCVSYYSEDTVETVISDSYVTQIIHFPEIKVTNSRKNETIIYDLFIRLQFHHKNFKLSNIQALKSTYTPGQFKSNYLHSHISGQPLTWVEKNYICFGGNTAINNYFMRLDYKFDLVEYDLFLGLLDSWLKHESLDGGPYKYIHDIKKVGEIPVTKADHISNVGINSTIVKKTLAYLVKNNISIKLKEQKFFEDSLLVLDEDYIENILSELPFTPKAVFDPNTNMYYRSSGSDTAESIEREFKRTVVNRTIIFKGNTIHPKMIDTSIPVFNTKKVYPKLQNSIIDYLKKILNAKQQNARISFTE